MIYGFKPTSDTIKFVDNSSVCKVVLHNTRSKLDQSLKEPVELKCHCNQKIFDQILNTTEQHF